MPNIDMGDFVTIENASKIKTTEKKLTQKKYYRHSGYAQGLKTETMKEVFEKNPSEVIRRSISRMLPKNKLRNERMKRLTVKN